jgi:hypothetical protein
LAQFSDREGREWSVSINVSTIKRVREQAETNLLDVLEDGAKLLAALYDDPIRLVEVLYAVCEPQIQQRELTPEQFGEGFAGDILLEAADALLDGLTDFFQRPEQRRMLRAFRSKVNAAVKLRSEAAIRTVEAIDPELIHAQATSGSATALNSAV